MKKAVLLITYFSLLSFVFFLGSCQKEQFIPFGQGSTNMDTTWIDSTGGGNPGNDSLYIDFTPHGGSGVWDDSTGTNPNDSTGNPGGGFTGGFGFNPHGNSGVWIDSTGTNPNDTIGGGTNPNDTLGGGN